VAIAPDAAAARLTLGDGSRIGEANGRNAGFNQRQNRDGIAAVAQVHARASSSRPG